MEATLSHSKVIQLPPLKKLLILCFVIAMLVTCTHAVIKHGIDAELVRKCMDEQGPFAKWVKLDGRVIWLCQLPDGRYGIQIRDPWEQREITSFPKDKMTRLDQVEQWLRNIGAEKVTPP